MRRDGRLRRAVQQRLQGFATRRITDPHLRHAAVALALVDAGLGAGLAGLPHHERWSRSAALLLTRRATCLRRVAGLWGLRGGRLEVGVRAELEALRELIEEVGLALDASHVLGRLDDVPTRSGFVITPVVLWAGAARHLQPDPREVASIHRIPLAELLRRDAPMLEATGHSEHPVLRMPIGASWIAAPTAAALYQFRELCLLGRATRVAHFDQPEFAWR